MWPRVSARQAAMKSSCAVSSDGDGSACFGPREGRKEMPAGKRRGKEASGPTGLKVKKGERSEIESLFFYSNSFQIPFQIVFKSFCKLLNNHSIQK